MTTHALQRPLLTLASAISATLALALPGRTDDATAARPLRALLITGGCCHDDNNQKAIIPEGVSARANVRWTVVQEGGTSKDHRVSLYESPGWADGYDVVHNECFGLVADPAFVEKIPPRNATAPPRS